MSVGMGKCLRKTNPEEEAIAGVTRETTIKLG
jgi:hypothetical protein